MWDFVEYLVAFGIRPGNLPSDFGDANVALERPKIDRRLGGRVDQRLAIRAATLFPATGSVNSSPCLPI